MEFCRMWMNNFLKFLSKNMPYPCIFGTISSAPATLCEPPTTTTTSGGEKPTSPKRSRIVATLSKGWGTRPEGAGATGAARPLKNGIRGAPGHCTRLTAPASWTLEKINVGKISGVSEKYLQVTGWQCVEMFEKEWAEGRQDIVNTQVSWVIQLCLIENDNGAVSASTSENLWIRTWSG